MIHYQILPIVELESVVITIPGKLLTIQKVRGAYRAYYLCGSIQEAYRISVVGTGIEMAELSDAAVYIRLIQAGTFIWHIFAEEL